MSKNIINIIKRNFEKLSVYCELELCVCKRTTFDFDPRQSNLLISSSFPQLPHQNLVMRSTHLVGGDLASASAMGGHPDRVYRALAVASLYILIRRWRAGGVGLSERPAPAEIAAAAALCTSVAWLYVLPALGLCRSTHRRRHQD